MMEALTMLSRVSPTGFERVETNTTAAPAALTGAASFDAVLGQTMNRAVESLQNAETMSVKAIRGEAETREVADAVMSAEQSLQAAVAIRDKLVQAYLEISRMQI